MASIRYLVTTFTLIDDPFVSVRVNADFTPKNPYPFDFTRPLELICTDRLACALTVAFSLSLSRTAACASYSLALVPSIEHIRIAAHHLRSLNDMAHGLSIAQ